MAAKSYAGAGVRLRQVRKDRGLTIANMAKELGISYSHLANVETGITGVGIAALIECSARFGVSLEWLKHGSADMNLSPQERIARMRKSAADTIDTNTRDKNTGWLEKAREIMERDQQKIQYAVDLGTSLEVALARVGREIDSGKQS
jgi:transcriptional regulator with XRE-family HTH domain